MNFFKKNLQIIFWRISLRKIVFFTLFYNIGGWEKNLRCLFLKSELSIFVKYRGVCNIFIFIFSLFHKCSVLTGMNESNYCVSVIRTLSKIDNLLQFIASLLCKYHSNFNFFSCFLKHSNE